MKETRRTHPPKIAPRWQRLIDTLRAHPLMTLGQLAETLGWKPETVQTNLSLMRQAGIQVVTEFRYGSTRYRLPEEKPFTRAQTLALRLTMCLDELSDEELQALIDACQVTMALRSLDHT